MRKSGKLFMFAVGALVSGVVFGQQPYKIGQVGSLTGFGSYYGIVQKEAALIAVEEINRRGGVNGHPLELIIYDNESDSTKGILAVKKLIEVDNVLVVFGPNMTGDFKAATPIFAEKNVVGISTSGSRAVGDPAKKWIFQVCGCSDWGAQRRVEFYKERGWTNLGLLTEKTAFGLDETTDIKAYAAKMGLKIVREEFMGPSDLDMSPQLLKLAAAKPDVIVATGSASVMVAAKNRKTLGIKIPFTGGTGSATHTFIDVAKDAAEGVIVGGVGIMTAPDQIPNSHISYKHAQYMDKLMMQKYGKRGDSFGGNIWDAYFIVAEAMKRSGPDRVKLRDEVEKTTRFVAAQGEYTFSPEQHRGPGVQYMALWEITGGKFKLKALKK